MTIEHKIYEIKENIFFFFFLQESLSLGALHVCKSLLTYQTLDSLSVVKSHVNGLE
jgi:hypothetical protein